MCVNGTLKKAIFQRMLTFLHLIDGTGEIMLR